MAFRSRGRRVAGRSEAALYPPSPLKRQPSPSISVHVDHSLLVHALPCTTGTQAKVLVMHLSTSIAIDQSEGGCRHVAGVGVACCILYLL